MGYGYPVTSIEREILETLLELEHTVSTGGTGQPGTGLPALFERIDTLAAHLPRDTEPDLLHYLHRKSYQKARLFLEGRNSLNAQGTCGRGTER